jgi:hypothetical protein
MSELIFREMAKGNAEDLAQVVEYFGDEAHEFFEQGFRYIIGYRNNVAIIGATCDSGYNEFDIESDEGVSVYESMIAEVERLAIGVGATWINTIADATTDRPKFIAGLVNRGFDGLDCCQLKKVLDVDRFDQEREKVKLDIANAELSQTK